MFSIKKQGTAAPTFVIIMLAILALSSGGAAASDGNACSSRHGYGSPELEDLDRGLVAATTAEGVFLSWRLMKDEAYGYSETGLTAPDFRVYRDGKSIAVVADSTNYLDREGTPASTYSVRPEGKGKGHDKAAKAAPWPNPYYDLPLKKPADGITPAGEAYTYSANDMCVGDVDGDGAYEYVVKWDPSNSKDVSQKGYTGRVFVDCYELDGTIRYRIDLGVNVRAGAHYTQILVYDFDCDGKAEMMFKTAPGTKIIRYDSDGNVASEKFITMPEEDIAAGYAHTDDYRLSRTGYFEHVVKMFMSWSSHPEVLSGRWPQSLEECFGIEKQYAYPLSRADAESLANYFIDVYAVSRSTRNVLREFEGFIVDGPEYLTVFNGKTGRELQTIRYEPGRYDDGLMWGDYAMARIEPANRVDRFLAGVAYLDGKKPYAVFARGYYTRSTIATYTWDGRRISKNWFIDSGWTPMTNPFNDGPHGRDGTDPEYKTLTTQGAHSLSIADVDDDGCQEIIYGSATIDNDGKLLYSSMAIMPPESATPGVLTRLGHGDSLHVADIDPDRPGLEIFMCFEGGRYAPYGFALRDARTGEVIFGSYTGKDTGRCMIGDVDPTVRGLEAWAVGLWSATGTSLGATAPGTNANIKWAADMSTQIVDGAIDVTPTIVDRTRGVVLTASDTKTNNYTKGNPCLVADIFGDWREELVVRKADSTAVRIYLSTEVTNHKMYTLMHDVQYRTGIAWQNVVYNQPSYPSFYFATDMDWRNVPVKGDGTLSNR